MGPVLLILAGLILFRTITTKPWPVYAATEAQKPLPDSAIVHTSRSIQIATVSISDSYAIDTAACKGFNDFLVQANPLIHQRLSKIQIKKLGKFGADRLQHPSHLQRTKELKAPLKNIRNVIPAPYLMIGATDPDITTA